VTAPHSSEVSLEAVVVLAVNCIKAMLPGMLARGQGEIVNVASVSGTHGIATQSGYSASKHALLGFADSLSQELLGTGVRISNLCPGGIETPFWDGPTTTYPGDRGGLMTSDGVAQMLLATIDQPRNVITRRVVFFPDIEWH
jgi:short-subunit dehydrogenase